MDPDTGACVSLVAGAAGPLGGDHFRLDIVVLEGATLTVSAVAATLVLPGPHGLESHSEVNIKVSSNSTLVWIPGRQIVAQGCHHQAITRIDLEKGARLFAREEILLGRHGEIPGALRQRIRVTYAGIACHDQELAVGAGAIGWESSAVTGGRRALGSIIIVDPDASNAFRCGGSGSAAIADTAVLKLNERTTLITSLAPDAIILGRQLDAAFAQYSRQDTAVGEAESDEESTSPTGEG